MSVSELCSRDLVTIDASASPAEAAQLMRQHHVGALVVTAPAGEGRAVRGVVTDRDLAVQLLAHGPGGAPARVGDLASTPPVAVAEQASLAEALSVMQSHGVRRLLVTAADGHLSGLLSLDDVWPALARQVALAAEVARAGAAREAAARPVAPTPPLPRVQVPAVGTAGWRP
jgi:CBS domain-containing protein